MAIVRKICILLRKVVLLFITPKAKLQLEFSYSNQAASDCIQQFLESDKPAMIARFGSVELSCVADYASPVNFKNCVKYILGISNHLGYSKSILSSMRNNAGFFPVTKENLDRFSELMLESMSKVDILGSWREEEIIFKKELNAIKVPLGDLEPYFHKKPWSVVLEGKKILVIHPFEESIIRQYEKRSLLFDDKRILPNFNLKTIKAVQSIAGNPCGFATWFDALDHMKEEIDKQDFDIAIIGCGAYGFPLAAYIKSLGKKAVHLGGATQILFGVKGKSWEQREDFKQLFNDFWIYPKISEIPNNFLNVENGRYW